MDEDFVVAFLDEHYHSGDILERAQMMLAEREAEALEIEKDRECVETLEKELERLKTRFAEFDVIDNLDMELVTQIRSIRDCQNSAKYVRLLTELDELNRSMNEAESVDAILPLYHQLREIAAEAEHSSLSALKGKVLEPLVRQWSAAISAPVAKLVADEFKALGFPFEEPGKQVQRDLSELKAHLVMLDGLDVPSHLRRDEPPLPIKTLLTQLEKKFQFFFYSSSSKLNDVAKPEYYFGIVLKWLQSNQKFIECHIEELFEDYSALDEFAQALVALTRDKVKSDLPLIQDDDVFSHMIDEILSYDAEFVQLMPQLAAAPRPVDVLSTNIELIERWIEVEHKHARLSMDTLIQSDEHWAQACSDRLASDFLELIQITTRRCRVLDGPMRLRFYRQQLVAIDDFQMRLTDVYNDTQSHRRICVILNTVYCVHVSISNWEELSPYSQALANDDEFQCQHDAIVGKLNNFVQKIVHVLVRNAVDYDLCHDSVISAYNNIEYSHLREAEVADVSPDFLPVLSKVELHLQQFKSALLDEVVRLVLKHLAKQIDVVLMEQVYTFNERNILKNKAACRQVQNDLENCLFPLFKVNTPNSRVFFSRLVGFLDQIKGQL